MGARYVYFLGRKGCWRNSPYVPCAVVRLKKHSFWIRHNKQVNQINGPAIWNAEAILLSWRILDELERSGETLAIAWTQGIASVEFKWCRQIISTPLPQNAGTNSPLLFWNRYGIAHRLFSNLTGKQNAAELDIYPIVWRQFSWKFAIEKHWTTDITSQNSPCAGAPLIAFFTGYCLAAWHHPGCNPDDTSLIPLCLPGFRGTKEVPKRYQRGPKEEKTGFLRDARGALLYFRGRTAVPHSVSRSLSRH